MAIKNVAVIGTGLIGSSWATLFASKNLNVKIYDINREALNLAEARIKENYNFLINEKVYTEKEVDNFISDIVYTTSIEEAVKDADFIQENGPDRIEIKRSIFHEIETYAPATAIYATSTSSLLVTDITEGAEHPERCVGGHPYNPPHLIPLVEITKGAKTNQNYIDEAYEFYTSIGKIPVILHKESMGFIANRLQAALNRELIDMVTRGVCTVEDADKACTYGPGLRWGILGQTLIAHLGGGKMGIKGMIELTKESSKAMFGSLANWSDVPENWGEIAQDGVMEEMEHRPENKGKNEAEIAKYRDHMLVEMLRLHDLL